MGRRFPLVLAGASLLTLASALTAQAQTAAAGPAAPASAAAPVTLGEIVVTARRRSESLQQAPLSVNAVTAESVQKLRLQQFQDIQAVVPGLTLQQGSSGFEAAASLRGVTFNVNTGAQPTVAMYLNDAPVQANFLFQSLFDVGQIEVLRGPQGTTRGIAAPSGAITLTSHKPDLARGGGYLDVTATDLQGRIVQGALNLPLIEDRLALRIAGVVDQNDANGVRSLHDPLRPRQVTSAERISLAFRPNERINGTLVYQHLDRDLTSFQQVIGPGEGSRAHPPLDFRQRAAVTDGANVVRQHTDVLTANIEADFSGRRVIYTGSYQRFGVANRTPQDLGDVLPGIELFQTQNATQTITTHELRLTSIAAPGRLLDYTVGGFYQWSENTGRVQQVAALLPGAFGPPGSFDLAAYDPRYQAPVFIDVPGRALEASIYGSLTLHIGDKTELSGGARHIFSMQKDVTDLSSGAGLIALPSGGGPCPPGQAPSAYAGFCDLVTPTVAIQNLARRTTARPNIYNVSISRRLTPRLMIYANTGTAWRPGPTTRGVFNATGDATLNALTFLQPESSRSYEIGLKSTFGGGRGRLNLAVWRQNYRNLIVYTPNVPYLSNSGAGFGVSTFNFTANADAVVGGVDVDAAFQITPDWSLAFQYSYAGGHLAGEARLPCNDADFNGVPDQGAVTSVGQFPAGTLIALCRGGPIARTPLWNASLQTEYVRPVAERVDGFLRGLVTYAPENARAEPGLVVPNYSLVNLYAGLRSHDGAWEMTLFARNAFATEQLLDRGVQFETAGPLSAFFPERNVGFYRVATTTPRREVGLSLRYAWGSR